MRTSLANLDAIIPLINNLKNLDVGQISADPLIQTQLKKIKMHADMALCAEEMILILVQILTLKHTYRISSSEYRISSSDKLNFDDPAYINKFVQAILHLFELEENKKLSTIFPPLLNQFAVMNEKDFYHEINALCENYLSSVDIDFVMQAATRARRTRATENKNAILVVGMTGAGKSFVINYLGYEAMFSRKLFSHDLQIDLKKQPSFLRHITIGTNVVSETSVMGVVDVDLCQSKGMEKFRNKNYVLCDTPGAADNRNFGPELKLANALETIAPVYKSQSVRFLVLVSAESISARGAAFKETLQFVAKMFSDATAIQEAAKSMVFAITGDAAKANYNTFKDHLEQFLSMQTSLGLEKKDIALIRALIDKFTKNQILFICPGKEYGATPEKIMSQLHACPSTDPKNLRPFAEDQIGQQLKHETLLIIQSIERIFEMLEADIDKDIKEIQVQRLTYQFAKLIFVDTFYTVEQSNIFPYFTRLVKMMKTLEKSALDILCPQKGGILEQDIPRAMSCFDLLDELDHMVRMLMNSLFGDNRDRVIALIRTFNTHAMPPNNYDTMDEKSWNAWVDQNRPENFVSNINDAIKRYRLAQVKKLKGLLDIVQLELKQQSVQQLIHLQNDVPFPVDQAQLVPVNANHEVIVQHINLILNKVTESHTPVNLQEVSHQLIAKLKNAKEIHGVENSEIIRALQDVTQNIRIQNDHFTDLFGVNSTTTTQASISITPSTTAPSAPPIDNHESKLDKDDYAINILHDQFRPVEQSLINSVHEAIVAYNFVEAMNAIDRLNSITKIFGFVADDGQHTLTSLFIEHFTRFMETTNALFELPGDELFVENQFQKIMLNMRIINDVTKHKTFEQYRTSSQKNSHSLLNLQLNALSATLEACFTLLRQETEGMCSQPYTSANFTKLGETLQKLWCLLSLPYENHEKWVVDYANLVSRIKTYCAKSVGEFSGHLQIDAPVDETRYQAVKAYYDQFSSEKWVKPLRLRYTEDLKNALVYRAMHFVTKVNQIDLDLGKHENLESCVTLVKEMEYFRDEFQNILDQSTVTKIRTALQDYNKKIVKTLENICSLMALKAISMDTAIPIKLLQQSVDYIHQCEAMGLAFRQIQTAHDSLVKYIQQCSSHHKLAMTTYFATLSPNADNQSLHQVKEKFEQYSELQEKIPSLYENCDQPITLWIATLENLVQQYQEALTQCLQRAAHGDTSHHEQLLAHMVQLIQFDIYIKNNRQELNKKPLTFKHLYTRFQHAFEAEYFPKLREVMQAVFDADFSNARKLTTQDKALAPGTEMRLVLVEQIGIYILASINTVERSIDQLKTHPIANPSYMKDLMKGYQRIESAQSLVDAGLLSKDILAKREQLLRETQTTLDIWLQRVIEQIDRHLEQLDFKSVSQQLEELQSTVNTMKVKPNNVLGQIENIHGRFSNKIQLCQKQFKQPLDNWKKNSYSIAQVAAAFTAAKELMVSEKLFAQDWLDISTQIYETIDVRCTAIEKQFSNNEIGAEGAVSQLEYIRDITLGTPEEATDLIARIKERYRKTVDQIQQDNLQNKKGDAKLKNIQELLAASDRLAKALGAADISRVTKYLQTRAQKLRTSIEFKMNLNQVPFEELIAFVGLYQRFANQFNFLREDHTNYVNSFQKMIQHACERINKAKTQYSVGTEQIAALSEIHQDLAVLIKIQRLSQAINTRAALINQNLPGEIVTLLLDFKQLLLANYEKYQSALKGRKMAELLDVLAIAQAFQPITSNIAEFITVCDMSALPENFRDLKNMNNDYSYHELRNKLLKEIKKIKSELEALNPKSLKQEGKQVRENFYLTLKRNIEFIEKAPNLNQHFDDGFLSLNAMQKDFGLEQCLIAIANFLAETFRLANNQLTEVTTPSATSEWTDFNRYYQELTIFVTECGSAESLYHLRLSMKLLLNLSADNNESVAAPAVAQHLVMRFGRYLEDVISRFKTKYFVETMTPEGFDQDLINLLAGLQKMSEDMPVLVDTIKRVTQSFLSEVQQQRSEHYMAFLARQLQEEENGFGARMVAEQPVFAGMTTAGRNKLTMTQDIDYVLRHMEVQDEKTGKIRSLTSSEMESLKSQYLAFETTYDRLINIYIASNKDFAKFSQVHLGDLKSHLLSEIQKINPAKMNGRILWNNQIAQVIPTLYAYIFAIWTLQESPAFFSATNTSANQHFLKKPHPAQIVAIYQMLNINDADTTGLRSHLNEVLTGEGKSVVLAATAALLALLGFAVDVGCYSEYLSGRDSNGFAWMFKFLEIEKYIQYGTFNGLSEDMLNQRGDLRHLMSNALFNTTYKTEATQTHGRPTVALVDEVDSLVTAFFGHLYQPYFLLQDETINQLFDAIWTQHQNGAMTSLQVLLHLPEYKTCLDRYPHCDYLITSAVKEMYEDLGKYKPNQGHDFYVNGVGEIYYKHFDGTTQSKSIGYRTYWACRESSNNVSASCLLKHQGIKVTCGAFSYAEIMRDNARYCTMLGATGTYRELSQAEKAVVKEVFGIQGASFIPSSYGKNKLTFNPGQHVKVVADDEYNLTLCKEIVLSQIGWKNNESIRPVIVFFENKEALHNFYNSSEFERYRRNAKIMTSETITTTKERDSLISQATRAGQITLAVQEHGRGSDFILTDPKVIANGGMCVIDGYMPITEAEQRQHQGRAARQGQDGSFGMVLKESEITKQFGLTNAQIAAARYAGQLYDVISAARNKKFASDYQSLVDDSTTMIEKLHNPSMQLLTTVRSSDSQKDDVIKAHKQTLPSGGVQVKTRDAKVLILFDSTGSMGSLITALKDTLVKVVTCLGEVLSERHCTFQLQFAHYEDYDSGPDKALRTTTQWSCDPTKLSAFIQRVFATGGGGNNSECVELGLYHANQLAKDGLSHVILIGDEPPSPRDEMETLRKKYTPSTGVGDGAYWKAAHYTEEVRRLKEAGVPVSTFFTRTSKFCSLQDAYSGDYLTERAFAKIAKETGGEAGELHLNDTKQAAQEVTTLFATKIIQEVAPEDHEFANELYQKFQERMQQFSR